MLESALYPSLEHLNAQLKLKYGAGLALRFLLCVCACYYAGSGTASDIFDPKP